MSIKEEINISKLYSEDCSISKEEFFKKYNIKETGLTDEEFKILSQKYGQNEITQTKSKKWYNFFLESLFSPFNSILLGITLILIYTDVILPQNPSFANIIVIAILVIASTLLDFFEEYRSNKAAEKLKELVQTTTTVIRDGKKIQIPIKEITISDTVLLSAGSIIPADLRIIDSKDLYVRAIFFNWRI